MVGHRALRVFRSSASGLGVLLLFVFSLVAGAALHLDLPRTRKVVAREVDAILAPSFQGRIHVERIGRLGLFGLSRTDLTADDPRGRPVVTVRGVRVRVATLTAVLSALVHKARPIAIRLSVVSIDDADVRLDTDPKGQLDLVSAFSPTSAPTPASPNARGLELVVSRVILRHIRAHGQIAGAPPLDVDVRDFAGAFAYTPDALEGDVLGARIVAHRIANGQDVDGSLAARVTEPLKPGSKIGARMTWNGAVAGIAHSIRAAIDGDKIDAVLDVPEARAVDLRAFLPGLSVDQPSSAHLEAHGVLPTIDASLQARLGTATVDARGNIRTGDEKHARLTFDSRDIDVRLFAKSAPPSRLALTGTATGVSKVDGTLQGDLALRLLGGRVGGHDVPAATATASIARSLQGDLRGRLRAVVDEPSLPTTLNASLAQKGKSSAIAFDLTAESVDLRRVPELRQAVGGSARVHASGELDLSSNALQATLTAKAQNVERGNMRLDAASLEASAVGTVTAPRIDVAFRSQGIVVDGRRIATAEMTAVGTPTQTRLTATARSSDVVDLDASADLDVDRGMSFKSPRVLLQHAGERALLTADSVGIDGGDVRVDGARLEGLGAPLSANGSLSGNSLHLHASTDGLDLGRLARLAQLDKNVHAGTLAIDADVDVRRNEAAGHATISVAGASIRSAHDLAANVHVEAAGRHFAGKVHAQATGIGSLDVDAPRIDVSGSVPLLKTPWRLASGSVGIDARADLARVAALVPAEDLPLSDARGEVVFHAHLARDDVHDHTPELEIALTTDHLALAPKESQVRNVDGALVTTPPSWRLKGVDFVVDGNVDGTSGDTHVAAQARDASGDLARLNFESPRFPYADVFENTGRLTEDIERAPLDLTLVIPEQGLDRVPDVLRQDYVQGKLQANVTVKGTLLVPAIEVNATLKHSRFSTDAAEEDSPLDFDIAAHYDGRRATASIKALSDETAALDATGELDAVAAQLFTGAPSASWRASGAAHFDHFPLHTIAAVGDKLISGRLSGDVSLANLHEDARAHAALSVDDLKVGTFTYKSARLDAAADGQVLDAKVRIDEADGFGEARAHAAAGWGAAIVPTLDPARPLEVTLASKNFRIGVLTPLVEGTLDELDGRIDSDARLELDPKTRGARLSGGLVLREGVIEAVAGGGELHDIAADVRFSRDAITLEKLTASGLTGHLEANGVAHLDGLNLRSAQGVIVIPSKSAIPVTWGGVEAGDVDGRLEITETTSAAEHTLNVNVAVPHLRVALPQGATTNAFALGPMDRVAIGARRGPEQTFVIVPLDPIHESTNARPAPSSTRVTVATHLADVQVVKDAELNVSLTGEVNVTSGATANVTGRILLKHGGTLVVQGKKFTVEEGTVTMVGADPSNPQVVVKAGWTAPDGTVVYATFVGPLKTGKVTLQSEPPLARQEIVQLLLYGTADGPQAPSQANAQNSAFALGNPAIATVGGQATQPLNHMFNQLGLGAVTASINTSRSSGPPGPQLEVQIARDLSLQIAYVVGNPAPGVNPDHTLVTLSYRFLSRWSLASTVGDAGTTIIDLLWRKRY